MDKTPRPIYPRFAASLVTTALQDTPVVTVIGPRQCGKTTLVRDLIAEKREFLTLDDDTLLSSARSDPSGLVRSLERGTIDEIQRAPDLLRAIKKAVDENRDPGRFLLTGSANLLALPQVSESLAGRMEIVLLLPLSQAEIHGRKPTFLSSVFRGKLNPPRTNLTGDALMESVLIGGYPEMLRRSSAARRFAWARDYVNAIVKRDVRDVAEIEKLDEMPRLLQILAHHSGQLVNFTQLGGQIGLDDKTTRKYVGILEQLFLLQRLQPWFRNRLSRLVKTSKLHFLDSGLLGVLRGDTRERLTKDRALFGGLLETFVFSELKKQISWSEDSYTLSHYRDKDQNEVDFVIEASAGTVVGIVVKAGATVNTSDFKGLQKLSEACGDTFRLGLVLYDGAKSVPFGERLVAASMSCLWS